MLASGARTSGVGRVQMLSNHPPRNPTPFP